MKKQFVFFFVFLFFTQWANSQSSDLEKYGIGFLIPEKGAQELCINFPAAVFDLYDTPGGNKIGTLYKKNFANLMYSLQKNAASFRIRNEDMAEFQNKTFCLKYFEEKNGFLKVLANSTGRGFWISKKDLGYLRITTKSWFDFFVEKKESFYPSIDIGLNLREKHEAKSKKIALLKGDYYLVNLTGKTEGLWAEVIVKKYNFLPCKAKDINTLKPVSEQSGWIKIVDDSGTPNIWFHTHGCK